MKRIAIPYFEEADLLSPGFQLFLNKRQRHLIDCVPWPSYSYKPNVSFVTAYNNNYIFLKYFVCEKSIRAAAGEINGRVWEDACVEFFIGFDESGYYNLEFNCIGMALAGFGSNRNDRELIAEKEISQIKSESRIYNSNNGTIQWELTVAIPYTVFVHHSIASLKGRMCRANFYKCGDLLPEPHFLSWSPINSVEPNFHLSQFFGTLNFE